VIAQHLETIRLRPGEGLLLSNTRWLHGRDRYIGPRTVLRILGDPLPGTGIMPGFPSSRTPDIAKADRQVRTLLPAHLLGSVTALPLGSSEN
jgi:hypothetical protein